MEANEMDPGVGERVPSGLAEIPAGSTREGGSIAVRGFELHHNHTGPSAAPPFVAESPSA